jgi:hypothetical protein
MGRVADFFREQSIPLAQQQRAKMVSLDRQVEELESKVQILETENLHLKAEVNPLKQRIKRLEQQVEQKPASAAVHSLEPTEIEMMKFIGDKRSTPSADIQKVMGLHSVAAEHFLARLLKAGYLHQQSGYGITAAHYSLSDKGNAYLIDNKLIPVPGAQAEQPNNPKGHHCDHCASTKLKRTGSRPDPTFSDVGIKQALYKCLDCQRESAFTNDEGH